MFAACTNPSKQRANEQAHQPFVASVRLESLPAQGFAAIHLFVESVEIRSGDSWQTLASPHRSVEVQKLPEPSGVLAEHLSLDRENYRQLRLRLAPDQNTIVLEDGATHPLLLPEDLKAGVPVELEGKAHRSQKERAFVLTLDLSRSIERREEPPGHVTYTLRPALRAVDRKCAR
jgi:hypothetical protein